MKKFFKRKKDVSDTVSVVSSSTQSSPVRNRLTGSRSAEFQKILSDGLGDISAIDIFSDEGGDDSVRLRAFAEAALHRRAEIVDGIQELRFLRQSLTTLAALASFVIQHTPRRGQVDVWEEAMDRLAVHKGSAERLAYYKDCSFQDGLFTSDSEAVACVAAISMMARSVTIRGGADVCSTSPVKSSLKTSVTASPLGNASQEPGRESSPLPSSPRKQVSINAQLESLAGPLDLRLFGHIDRLSLVDCRINVVHGVSPCVQLVLLRSTIISPALHHESLKSWACFPELRSLICSNADAVGFLPPDGVACVAETIHTLQAERSISGDIFPLVRTAGGKSGEEGDGFVPWHRLTVLDLRHNKLTTVHQSIRSAKYLAKLLLSNNRLVSLTPYLRFCDSLTHVDLQHNQLWNPTEISACLRNVTHLDISYNRLVSVWEIALLKNLVLLNVGFNILAHWSDIAHIAESCLAIRSITFRGNPLCDPSRIFGGDVNKLGCALFKSHRGVEVNGMVREMDEKQSQTLLSKYSHFFTEAARGLSMDALEADRAKYYDPNQLPQSLPGDTSQDPYSLPEGLTHASIGSIRCSSINDEDDDGAFSMTGRMSERDGMGSLGNGKIRTVKIVKKVVKKKKKEAALDADDCDDEEAQFSTSVINPDDHIDPVTGDKPDLAFLIGRYGPAKGLTRYNEMTEHLIRRSRLEARRRKLLEAEAAAAALDATANRPITPDLPPAPAKPVISALKGDDYVQTVDQGLHKFLIEEIQKKLGLTYRCFPVRSETIPGTASQNNTADLVEAGDDPFLNNKSLDWSSIQHTLVASHFETVQDHHAEANPLLRYTGKNIWQVGLGTGRYATDVNNVVEVWVSDEESGVVPEVIDDSPSRYNGRVLIKVEKFDYDCSIGFAVRQKHVETVDRIVNFPQPILTSVHFCPWSHGKADIMMDVNNIEVVTQSTSTVHNNTFASSKRTNSSDSLDTIDGTEPSKVKMTLAQKREMVGTYSRPSTPQMLVGIVVPNASMGATVMKMIFQKFRDFRNPHYVLQRLDWPLMTQRTGHISAMQVHFHGNGMEQAEALEVFRGLAEDKSGDSTPLDDLPDCDFREELIQSIQTATSADPIEVAVHQRLGSMFRVHPEEISFHIRALLIPPGCNDSEIRIVGSSFANANICPVDSSAIASDRDIEFSVFIVVLSTTFCMFEDFNFEGSSARHSDDLFKPIVTYDITELSFVAIGFGANHLILNFGKGTDEIVLYFRDVTSTLRMIGFLREASSSRCSFVMLPWYRKVLESIDRNANTTETVAHYFQCFLAQLSVTVQSADKRTHTKYSKVSMSTLDFDAGFASSKRDFGASSRTQNNFLSSMREISPTVSQSPPTKRRFGFGASKKDQQAAVPAPVEYQWEGRSYPLRHIPPLTQTCWERVSIFFTRPSYRVYIVTEHANKWAGDPIHFADEVLSFPVLGVSFIEVCPRLSKVPLIAVIHADLSGGESGATIDKFLLVFQHDSTLEAFVSSIQKFHSEATATLGGGKSTSIKVSAASVLFKNDQHGGDADGSTLLVTQIAARSSQHNSAISTEQVLRALLD